MKPDIKEQIAKKITADLMKEYHGYRPNLSLNAPGLLMKFDLAMGGEEGVTQDPEYMKMIKKKLKGSMGKKLLIKRATNAAEQAQGYDD